MMLLASESDLNGDAASDANDEDDGVVKPNGNRAEDDFQQPATVEGVKPVLPVADHATKAEADVDDDGLQEAIGDDGLHAC